jgi:hypothetical protein
MFCNETVKDPLIYCKCTHLSILQARRQNAPRTSRYSRYFSRQFCCMLAGAIGIPFSCCLEGVGLGLMESTEPQNTTPQQGSKSRARRLYRPGDCIAIGEHNTKGWYRTATGAEKAHPFVSCVPIRSPSAKRLTESQVHTFASAICRPSSSICFSRSLRDASDLASASRMAISSA